MFKFQDIQKSDIPMRQLRNEKLLTKKRKEDYYRQQIQGLYFILDDADDKDFMISRNYVKEKLKMILDGGINFHPTIKHKLGLK